MANAILTNIRRCPPVSNRERQRQFRDRNPGYFSKYAKTQRALARRAVAAKAAQPATMLALPEPVVSLLPDLLDAAMKRMTEPVSQSANVERELPIVF